MFYTPVDLTNDSRTTHSALEIAIRARETEKLYALMNEIESSHTSRESKRGKFARLVVMSVQNFLTSLFA